jgi:hypothetical protein
MTSNSERPPTLRSLQSGSDAWKAGVEKLKISPPVGCTISSVESLARWLKERDADSTWLQSKEEQNIFLQHARDAVMRVIDKREDGQYITSWAKAGTVKRSQMIDQLNKFQPALTAFKDQWVAELFLSKCIKTKNVKRGAKNVSDNAPNEPGTLMILTH